MSVPPDLLDTLRGTSGGVWPPLVRGPAAELALLLLELDRSQWLDTHALAARAATGLRVLLPHLAAQSAQFAARVAMSGVPVAALHEPRHFHALPLLDRRALQQAAPADLYCRALPQSHLPLTETQTSGSSGMPVVVRRTYVTQQFWRALNLRAQREQGADLTVRSSVVRPHADRYSIEQDTSAHYEHLFRGGPLQSIPIDTDIVQQMRWLAEFQPERLVVYPTNLEALCRWCVRHGQPLTALRQVSTLAETLHPAQRALCQATFGVAPLDVYSSQEVGLIAVECPASGLYHVCAESLVVEVLRDDGSPCGEGEVGRVVVTDLVNYATPVVRYALGDHAEVGGPCPCGRGAPTLRRVLGRTRNLVMKPDGTRYWPTVGFARYREVAPVVQYQVVQIDLTRIEFRAVTERALESNEEAALRDIVQGALGYPFDIAFTYFEGSLPRSAGGKFEEFMSLLPEEAIFGA